MSVKDANRLDNEIHILQKPNPQKDNRIAELLNEQVEVAVGRRQ